MQRREERPKVGFWHEHEAHRQSPVLSVDRLDPVVPVQFLGRERGLAVHFEGKDLVEFALSGQWQAYCLAQHVLLAKAQDRRFMSRTEPVRRRLRPLRSGRS